MRTNSALLLIAGLMASRGAAAQSYAMDRGAWQLDGTVSFTHQRYTPGGAGFTVLSLHPQIGYFITQGLALTANLQLVWRSGQGTSATIYGAGPGLAYYFNRGPGRLHPYLAANTQYAHQGTSHTLYWSGAGGLAVLIARNVAITGELFYDQYRYYAGGQPSSRSEIYGSRFGVAVYLY